MMRRLRAALDDAAEDASVRCVILTATGKGFCAGQDLNVLSKFYENHDRSEISGFLDGDYNAVIERMWSLEKPIIAAVQGVAAGAGWSLALACDIRLAARSARLVPGFGKLGLVPDMGGTWTLVRAVGYAKAMEFALFTDALTADEALSRGLLNAVAPDDALLPMALAWAARVAKIPSSCVALTKRALQKAVEGSASEALNREAFFQAVAASAPEHAEQLAAFVSPA
jgi:2-(1,2-epoxy-1,2-dihydrophenyl)acetyl-CoA isomerase